MATRYCANKPLPHVTQVKQEVALAVRNVSGVKGNNTMEEFQSLADLFDKAEKWKDKFS